MVLRPDVTDCGIVSIVVNQCCCGAAIDECMIMHAYIHLYIYTYIHSYIHTYIHTSRGTCLSGQDIDRRVELAEGDAGRRHGTATLRL